MKNEYRKYIDSFFGACISVKKNNDYKKSIFGLPHPIVSPNIERFKFMLFYWDSYFHIMGLRALGRIKLAKNTVDNLIYLYENFGFIPTANVFRFSGRSQPPLLSSMVVEVFPLVKSKAWLSKAYEAVKGEYLHYWTDQDHKMASGLSRYFDKTNINVMAEHESGWDLTTRFLNRSLDILPVDLNCFLYKYEKDLVFLADYLNKNSDREKFLSLKEKRRKIINKIFFSSKRGYYFDYDFKSKKLLQFYSLAGLIPLWSGLADEKQASMVVRNLDKFETRYGLTITARIKASGRQWDYPNGWAPYVWFTVKGLMDYGYDKEAKRIAAKWIGMNEKVFRKTGFFWEKYDAVKGDYSKIGRYPVQKGFGWSCAVYLLLTEIYNK